MTDHFGVHLNLQRHQQSEQKLVGNVETSNSIREGHKGQVVDDVLDALGRERRSARMSQRDVEQLQKLAQ